MSNAFDSAEYPIREPLELTVGDRWLWKRDLSDYDAASYTLSYQAVSNGATPDRFSITSSTSSGTEYLIEVASTTTVAYVAGVYSWAAFITRDSDSERLLIGEGTWRLDPNPATDFSDTRTYAQQQVDLLRSKLTQLNTRLFAAYSVGDRTATMSAVNETRRDLNHWLHVRAGEINAERVRSGRSSTNNLRVRF